MFIQFLEQKRFENGAATEVLRDNFREEFKYNYSDWKVTYYARQLVARYKEALGRSPGSDSKTVWDNIMRSAWDELRLGKCVSDYTYRVSDEVSAR